MDRPENVGGATQLLERDIEKQRLASASGAVTLTRDERSGTYVVTGVASERPRRAQRARR